MSHRKGTGNRGAAGSQGYFRFQPLPGPPLEKLVVSPSNQIAHQVLTGLLAGHPTPNPVLLVGPPGSGKSRLIDAFARSWEAAGGRPAARLDGLALGASGPDPRPPSLSLALEEHTAEAGVLLLDQVESIPLDPELATALWHVFNLFHGQGRPIVAAARRPPRELDNLDAHLRSRLAWGLVVSLAPPGEAARRAILDQLAAARALRLSAAVVDLILTRVERDPATLERVVAAIDGSSLESGHRIDRRLVRAVIEGPEFRPGAPGAATQVRPDPEA